MNHIKDGSEKGFVGRLIANLTLDTSPKLETEYLSVQPRQHCIRSFCIPVKFGSDTTAAGSNETTSTGSSYVSVKLENRGIFLII